MINLNNKPQVADNTDLDMNFSTTPMSLKEAAIMLRTKNASPDDRSLAASILGRKGGSNSRRSKPKKIKLRYQ